MDEMKGFWDDDFRKWLVQQYEGLCRKRKAREKPKDIYDRLQIQLDKMFERHYRKLLEY